MRPLTLIALLLSVLLSSVADAAPSKKKATALRRLQGRGVTYATSSSMAGNVYGSSIYFGGSYGAILINATVSNYTGNDLLTIGPNWNSSLTWAAQTAGSAAIQFEYPSSLLLMGSGAGMVVLNGGGYFGQDSYTGITYTGLIKTGAGTFRLGSALINATAPVTSGGSSGN